ncbi:MAG: hypothetical protein WD801_13420 [Gemmatimonadaceae bacterium]
MVRPTPSASADLRRWVETWRNAGPALASVKRDELRRLRTADALRQLADAFDAAVRGAPRTETSGLVMQQAIFQRLRR